MEKKEGQKSSNNGESSAWRLRDGSETNNNNSEEDMDDYCVYTYKGDSRRSERLADLPSSFFEFCSPSSAPEGQPRLSPLSLQGQETDSSSGGISANSSCGGRPVANGSNLVNGSGGSRTGNNNELYSPDMDFLEMDFDPGGTGDGDNCEHFDELNDG